MCLMPYDPGLAERLKEVLDHSVLDEISMFGGLGYLLNGNLCVGIYKEFLILRVGVETAQKILQEPHVLPMDITGTAMVGWAKIAPQGIVEDEDLERYCNLAVDFVSTLPAK